MKSGMGQRTQVGNNNLNLALLNQIIIKKTRAIEIKIQNLKQAKTLSVLVWFVFGFFLYAQDLWI